MLSEHVQHAVWPATLFVVPRDVSPAFSDLPQFWFVFSHMDSLPVPRRGFSSCLLAASALLLSVGAASVGYFCSASVVTAYSVSVVLFAR